MNLVELVDLYPTLCDLARITVPDNMEGTSLKPLLRHPERELKSAVFSQYHRRPKNTPDRKSYMGYSMVTTRYHYIEWYYWDNQKKKTLDFAAVELYDNQADAEENINIAGFPENAALVRELSQKLKTGWRASLHGPGTL